MIRNGIETIASSAELAVMLLKKESQLSGKDGLTVLGLWREDLGLEIAYGAKDPSTNRLTSFEFGLFNEVATILYDNNNRVLSKLHTYDVGEVASNTEAIVRDGGHFKEPLGPGFQWRLDHPDINRDLLLDCTYGFSRDEDKMFIVNGVVWTLRNETKIDAVAKQLRRELANG